MSLETQKFVRKPFDVEAVQVTEENFDEIVAWTDGLVETKDDGTRYIRVRVHQPINPEQTRAYVGDWVLYSRGFKVYKDRAFRNNFVIDNNSFDSSIIPDAVRNNLQTLRESIDSGLRVKNAFDAKAVTKLSNNDGDRYALKNEVDPKDQISGKRS